MAALANPNVLATKALLCWQQGTCVPSLIMSSSSSSLKDLTKSSQISSPRFFFTKFVAFPGLLSRVEAGRQEGHRRQLTRISLRETHVALL